MLRCLLTTSDFYSILILRTHWILGSHSLNNSESTIIHGNISILISQSVLTWFLRRIDFSNPFFRPGFCRFEQDCISRNIFNCPSFELLKSNLRKGYLGLGGCVFWVKVFFLVNSGWNWPIGSEEGYRQQISTRKPAVCFHFRWANNEHLFACFTVYSTLCFRKLAWESN